MNNTNEKYEIIEQALQASVGGGLIDINLCGATCSIFSIDICDVNFCEIVIKAR
jgi:hypothetical protein